MQTSTCRIFSTRLECLFKKRTSSPWDRPAVRCNPWSFCLLLLIVIHPFLQAAAYRNLYGKLPSPPTPGDVMLSKSLNMEARKLSNNNLTGVASLEEWNRQRVVLRQQLFEMVGLDPLPAKTDLKPTITGTIEQSDFRVEKLHFQSMPGLYVTANLYLPKKIDKPAPAILYVCGHSPAKTNGVSYGNKVGYQHHGIWFARNGYVCLVIDTVQLGEIEGIHHGTYREGMWWWNSRGYSSAGAEAWNCIRSLDYLESRPEVDGSRLGVTGRSGGGAYSWWVTALDDRIQAACPVAGITDLENHVVDGTVEGHCDCMFMVNTYRWDYARVAALAAPRPLLICNTDKDTIFPLDGVVRLHEQVRHVYDLHNAGDKLGLLITEGPHKDTQDLQVPVLRWFNRFLKQKESLVETAAVPMFSGQQLRVFDQLPADEITSKCYETFTRVASDGHALDPVRGLSALRRKTFNGWPETDPAPTIRQISETVENGIRFSVHEFASQPEILLRFYLLRPADQPAREVRFAVLDDAGWKSGLAAAASRFGKSLQTELLQAGVDPGTRLDEKTASEFESRLRYLKEHQLAWIAFAPRGVGYTALGGDKRYQVQIKRRFMLVGQTLAGMQVYDVRRGIQAARQFSELTGLKLHLHADPEMTEVTTFAACFEPGIESLHLSQPPRSDKNAPDFLNWSRIATPGQLLDLARSCCRVRIGGDSK